MSFSSLCTQQRDKERRALKPYLALALAGSAILHVIALVWLLQQAAPGPLTDLAFDVILVEPPTSSPASPAPSKVAVDDAPSNAPTATVDPASGADAEIAALTPSQAAALQTQSPSAASPQSQPGRTQPPAARTAPPVIQTVAQPASPAPTLAEMANASPPLASSTVAEQAPTAEDDEIAPPAESALPEPSDAQASELPAQAAAESINSEQLDENIPTQISRNSTPFPPVDPVQVGEALTRSWNQATGGGGRSVGSSSATTGNGVRDGSRSGAIAAAPGPAKAAERSSSGAQSLGGLIARSLSDGLALPGRPSSKTPECVVCSKPLYPAQAQQKGRQGKAQVSVDIDAYGNVTNVQLLESSGHPDLDQAAIKEAQTWKFKPTTRSHTGFTAAIQFRLKPAAAPAIEPAPASQPSDPVPTPSTATELPAPVSKPRLEPPTTAPADAPTVPDVNPEAPPASPTPASEPQPEPTVPSAIASPSPSQPEPSATEPELPAAPPPAQEAGPEPETLPEPEATPEPETLPEPNPPATTALPKTEL